VGLDHGHALYSTAGVERRDGAPPVVPEGDTLPRFPETAAWVATLAGSQVGANS
jgi:hypothetical protein